MNTALSAKDENQIRKRVMQSFTQLADASKALDSKNYFALFDADKFVGLNADGSNWNSLSDLKEIIDVSFNAVESVESLKFTNIKISVIDKKTAILVNEYEQIILLKNNSRIKSFGGGTQVWSKASGVWRLVSVSASTKPSK